LFEDLLGIELTSSQILPENQRFQALRLRDLRGFRQLSLDAPRKEGQALDYQCLAEVWC
jgi:hypothetical protein